MLTKRILCVDDDEDTRDLLTTLLDLSDLEAVSTPDVDGALRLMEREQFDLYTIDSQMPGVSGLTLCQRIRAIDKDTPILIFSGNAHQSDVEAGMLAGANAYLVKPNTSEFIATVRRLLQDARAATP
jgi:DNA-binding response OmpR family regulator